MTKEWTKQTSITKEEKFEVSEISRVRNSLVGVPSKFKKEDVKYLKFLEARGIAVNFEGEGWARGHNWRKFEV